MNNSTAINKKHGMLIFISILVLGVIIFFVVKKFKTSANPCPAGDPCKPTQEHTLEGTCDENSNCIPEACETGFSLNKETLTCSEIVEGKTCSSPEQDISNAKEYQTDKDGVCNEVAACEEGYLPSEDNKSCKKKSDPDSKVNKLKGCVFNTGAACALNTECMSAVTNLSKDSINKCLESCKTKINSDCLNNCDDTSMNNILKGIELKCAPPLAIEGFTHCATSNDKKTCIANLLTEDSAFVECTMNEIEKIALLILNRLL